MTRGLLLAIVLLGVATAWNYKTGYDSHPWNLKNVWEKRSEKSEEDLPQPPVREKAPTMSYIHKRNSASLPDVATTELPQPIVRENANNAEYIHKRNGVSPTNDEATDLPQPIVRKNAERIPGFGWF